jgi:hypothetical protein
MWHNAGTLRSYPLHILPEKMTHAQWPLGAGLRSHGLPKMPSILLIAVDSCKITQRIDPRLPGWHLKGGN